MRRFIVAAISIVTLICCAVVLLTEWPPAPIGIVYAVFFFASGIGMALLASDLPPR